MQTLIDRLLAKRTKLLVDEIGFDVINSNIKLHEFLDALCSDQQKVAERAAWVLYTITDNKPEILIPHIGQILHNLDKDHHDAVARGTYRYLRVIEIPEEYIGPAYERAFEVLANPNSAVASKIFSMEICANIATKISELIPELIDVIEDYLPHGTAGYRSMAKRQLKRLRKVN